MLYQKVKLVDGKPTVVVSKMVDQGTMTSDCFPVQIEGLSACHFCQYRGKRDCGGGKTLKRLKKEAREMGPNGHTKAENKLFAKGLKDVLMKEFCQ